MLQMPANTTPNAEAASHLEHISNLDIDTQSKHIRLSGIICTIGILLIVFKNKILVPFFF